jgi:hypothetical protein
VASRLHYVHRVGGSSREITRAQDAQTERRQVMKSHGYTYEAILAASERIHWRVEDLIGGDKKLDFSKPMMPESFARVEPLTFLSAHERLALNHIRALGYLYTFGLVEEFIVPFVLDHARPQLHGDSYAVRSLFGFAAEEAKHIHLFRRFREEFERDFGSTCDEIGPPDAVAKAVLAHQPLGVALAILQIEWMTLKHWTDAVQDNHRLDPQFKSLLKHHWMEESQHAKLDTLLVEKLATAAGADGIAKGFDDYAAIGGMLDGALAAQVKLDLAALERAAGRTFDEAERTEITAAQQKSYRWTFLASGMTHPNFVRTLGELSPAGQARIAEMAKALS